MACVDWRNFRSTRPTRRSSGNPLRQDRPAFEQRTRMKVTAAVVGSKDGPFQLEEVEIGEPRAGELLVKITAAGLCHTDLSVRSQATPFPLPGVLGHEGAGVVDQVGAQVSDFRVGDKVVLSFDSCGSCPPCQAGKVVYCQQWIPLNLLGGSRLDGSATLTRASGDLHGHFFGQSSFATHALVSARSAVKVDDDLDLSQLAPLGCSVQTGAGAVLNVARPEPGSTIVVFGAPPLGSQIPVDVPNLLGRGIRLLGTNQGDSNPRQFIPRLIELHRQGRLPFDKLIRSYAFDQINVAAQDAAEARTIKPVMILPP